MKHLIIALVFLSAALGRPQGHSHDLSATTRNLPSGSHGEHGPHAESLEHDVKKRTSDSHLRLVEDTPGNAASIHVEVDEDVRSLVRRAGVLEQGEKKKNYGNYPEKVLNGFAIERKQPVPEGYKGGDPRLSDPQYDDGQSCSVSCEQEADVLFSSSGSEDDVGPYGNRDY